MFDDAILAVHGKKHVCFSGRITPVELRTATGRDHGLSGFIGTPKDFGSLTLVPGLDESRTR